MNTKWANVHSKYFNFPAHWKQGWESLAVHRTRAFKFSIVNTIFKPQYYTTHIWKAPFLLMKLNRQAVSLLSSWSNFLTFRLFLNFLLTPSSHTYIITYVDSNHWPWSTGAPSRSNWTWSTSCTSRRRTRTAGWGADSSPRLRRDSPSWVEKGRHSSTCPLMR